LATAAPPGAEVAAKAGMSTGSLFTYVESKETLFHLVFLYCLLLLPDSPELPLRTPEPGAPVALFAEALDATPMFRLHAALVGDEPADVTGELRGIVAEIYDTLERAWPLLSVVERCAPKYQRWERCGSAKTARTYVPAWRSTCGGGRPVGSCSCAPP
jgi:AcrR family transcriptional regulator